MDLGIEAAYNCYMWMGMKPEAKTLEHLVLGIGKSQGLFSGVAHTEQYFYEEVVFAAERAREAEEINGFLSNVIQATQSISPSADECPSERVFVAMLTVGHEVAIAMMEFAGISPVKNDSWFAEFANERVELYEPLLQESFQSPSPIPQREFRLGFGPRDHPTLTYLGTVSDNFAASLDISAAEPTHATDQPMLQMVLMAKYLAFLRASAALGSMS